MERDGEPVATRIVVAIRICCPLLIIRLNLVEVRSVSIASEADHVFVGIRDERCIVASSQGLLPRERCNGVLCTKDLFSQPHQIRDLMVID